MSFQAIPYIVLLGLLFGTTLVASRFSVGQFEPLTYIGLRLTLASLGHLAIYMLSRRHWPTSRHLWGHAILLGILGTAVPMSTIVLALTHLSSGVAGILITTGPAFTVVMAHIALPDESLTWRKSLGVVLALGGAGLLALRGESGLTDIGQAAPTGYLLMLVAMLTGSGASVYARRFMRDLDAFDVASVRMVAAATVVVPISLIFTGFNLEQVTGQGYAALAYAAFVGTLAGMMLAFYNIKRFGATAAAMTAYVVPIVAGAGGILLLGEQFTIVMVAGVVLIIVGIALINQGIPKKTAP